MSAKRMYKQIRRRCVKGEKDPQNNKCHEIPYETRAGHYYIGTGHSVDLLNLIGKSFVKITLQNSRPISKRIEMFIAIWWGCLNKTFARRPPLCQHNSCTDIKPRTRSCHSAGARQTCSATFIISLFVSIDRML